MVEIQTVIATIDGKSVPLILNTLSGLYEAVTKAPNSAGMFSVEFKAYDILDNSVTAYASLTVQETVEVSPVHMCLNLLPDGYYLELLEECCCV